MLLPDLLHGLICQDRSISQPLLHHSFLIPSRLPKVKPAIAFSSADMRAVPVSTCLYRHLLCPVPPLVTLQYIFGIVPWGRVSYSFMYPARFSVVGIRVFCMSECHVTSFPLFRSLEILVFDHISSFNFSFRLSILIPIDTLHTFCIS